MIQKPINCSERCMRISKEIISKFIESGINVIGVDHMKRPIGAWKRYMTEMNKVSDIQADGLGLICGAISGNMEVVDIDLKNDDTGTLYEDYVQSVMDVDPELIDKLMIIETPSGGYHWIYRCNTIDGNQKLARKENKEVVIETRGEGGYIASIPMKGYKAVQGRFSEISLITEEERDTLLSCARYFNEYIEKVTTPKSTYNRHGVTKNGESSWDHYSRTTNCDEILDIAGWRRVKEDNTRAYYKRPGDSTASHSGNYHKDKNLFTCFSSSTIFEPGKAYDSFGVYAMLMHNGDFSEAAKTLYNEGWGDRVERVETHTEYREGKQKPVSEEIKDMDDISEFLSDAEEDEAYLENVFAGKEEMGLSTGSDSLDKHFLFKRGAFVLVVGHTNIGKTITILYLHLIAAMLHGHRSIIITMENKSGFAKRRLMEMYMMKPIRENKYSSGMTRAEFEEARRFVEKYFVFLKGRGGKVKTIPQLLNIAYKIVDQEKIDMMFVDPYSGFKRELKKNESTHDYDYDVAGDILDFCERTGVITILNSHTATMSRRRKDEDGTLAAPFMDDVEGGGKWPNRVDQAIVLHRKTTHHDPAQKYKTLFYLDKDRELEAGGSLTTRDEPVEFAMMPNMCEFRINGETSVVQLIKANIVKASKGVQSEIDFKKYEDFDLPF